LKLFTLSIAARPTIAGTSALLGDEDVLRVVEIGILALLDGVDDLGRKESTLGSRSMRMERGM
jgi:hypothetical protein